MDKSTLEKLCNAGASQRQIAAELGKSQTSIRYWLEKYGLKSSGVCTWCGEAAKQSCCAACSNQKYIQRWIRLKKKAIEYLGGKCSRCGYQKFYGALEFHHRDPASKEMQWSQLKKRCWDVITAELDKCDLLCANCHREVEDENRQV